jgi:hypothetical protein
VFKKKYKIIVESLFIRRIVFYPIFTKKKKSEKVEKRNLCKSLILVDIRNLKRTKRIQVEKTIFCGFKNCSFVIANIKKIKLDSIFRFNSSNS